MSLPRFGDSTSQFRACQALKLDVDAPALTETRVALDANFIRKGNVTFGFLINFSASEALDVALEGLGAIRRARGLSAGAILTPVTEFDPSVAGTTVSLPPMSLVRVESEA
jgi:hypothetical protein